MEKLIIGDLSAWLEENGVEIAAGCDGVLLDNFLGYSDNMTVAILETYATSNSSVYTAYMAETGTGDADLVEDIYFQREREVSEMGE